MEINLKNDQQIEVFKVLVDSLKTDLNKVLFTIESNNNNNNKRSHPTATNTESSNNNRIEILKFFLEEFKNDENNTDIQNCVSHF